MIKQKMSRIEYASDARSQLRSYFAYSYCSEKAVIRQLIGITAPAKHGGCHGFSSKDGHNHSLS